MDDKPYEDRVEEAGLKNVQVKGDNAAAFLEG